jgi:heat shock protein HslJ
MAAKKRRPEGLAAWMVITALAIVGLLVVSTSASGSGPKATLDGTSWKLAGWSISSLYPGDFEITATFSDGRISGKAAVNTYGGTYTVGVLRIGRGDFATGDLARTLMAGPEPAMRAEDLFLQLLGQSSAYSLDEGRLMLYGDGDNELLIFDPAE